MKKVIQLLIIASSLCSCRHQLRTYPSILESYKQYQILSLLKKELEKETLSEKTRGEMITLAEDLAPRDSEIKLIKAKSLRSRGEIEGAKSAIEEAIKLSPNYSPALSAYGELLVTNGKIEEGQRYCRYALQLNPIDLAARRCAR